MYKLLALDIDGTLLNPGKVITEEVGLAIRDLANRNVEVTLASGRFPASVWLHAKSLGLTCPLIALNGAVILDAGTGQEIKSTPLAPNVAGKIAEFAKENGVYVHYHGYNVLFVNEINEMNKKWAISNVVVDGTKELITENYHDQIAHFSLTETGSLIDFVQNKNNPPVYKATVLNDDPILVESLFQEINEWPELSVTRTGTTRFDINAANVSKKTALIDVCIEKGIDSKEVVAAGDYDNDSEMIRWAGLGVAMENGNELIKELSDTITLTNDKHGVAHLIEKYFI